MINILYVKNWKMFLLLGRDRMIGSEEEDYQIIAKIKQTSVNESTGMGFGLQEKGIFVTLNIEKGRKNYY